MGTGWVQCQNIGVTDVAAALGVPGGCWACFCEVDLALGKDSGTPCLGDWFSLGGCRGRFGWLRMRGCSQVLLGCLPGWWGVVALHVRISCLWSQAQVGSAAGSTAANPLGAASPQELSRQKTSYLHLSVPVCVCHLVWGCVIWMGALSAAIWTTRHSFTLSGCWLCIGWQVYRAPLFVHQAHIGLAVGYQDLLFDHVFWVLLLPSISGSRWSTPCLCWCRGACQ